MNRSQLIQNFFASMDSMARIGIQQGKAHERPKNLPPQAQMGALFMVSHRGPLTIKDLSQAFGMTSSAATQLVNGLVKGGYLGRKEDTVDRRKISLILTAKGKKAISIAKEHRMKKMIQMLEPLTDTELAQLLKIQSKIVEHWEITCKKIPNK